MKNLMTDEDFDAEFNRLMAEMDAADALKRATVAKLEALLASGSVEFSDDSGAHFAAVTPEAYACGGFRITRYDAQGLAGHTHTGDDSGAQELVEQGYTIPAPGSMDRLSRGWM